MTAVFLIRFAQAHETFRQPELEALAQLHDIKLTWQYYESYSPYAVVTLDPASEQAAQDLVSRSVLVHSIFEFWAQGESYKGLHKQVQQNTPSRWPLYRHCSFRFDVDTFQASRPAFGKKDVIESFSYLPFEGSIIMKRPDHVFTVLEVYHQYAAQPHKLFFGRWLGDGGRRVIAKYNLKKRKYIATTSMDAELSLLTANIAQAGPGKLVYDPFMGTGSFPVSCAAFDAISFGSDLDGRSIRGKGSRNVAANFKQYDKSSYYLGGFAADLTNTPIAARPLFDSIVCDPPYGVREGLKVLGHVKERLQHEIILNDGTPAHLQQDYIPPKRPYSFVRLLDDILDFAATRLVVGGRLSMWMPVAGQPESLGDSSVEESKESTSTDTPEEAVVEHAVPEHPCLRLDSMCRQDFTRWSRRLLTYVKLPVKDVDMAALSKHQQSRQGLAVADLDSMTADDLNAFRKKYFEGFKD